MTLKLTSGDTAPALTGTVSANITGATVVAHIKRPDRTVLTKTPTVTDAPTGAWSITWATNDLAQIGPHYPEIQVTFSSGLIQTFFADTNGLPVSFQVREQYA